VTHIDDNFTFKSRREMFAKNIDTGKNLRVVPAELSHIGGVAQGVAIMNGTYLLACITADDAWKLADKLADVIDGLQQDAA
jgi:hypothetical protein